MTKATILIVDDDPTNLSVLSQLLRPQYQVRAANSGTAALHAAVTEPRPDLILLDVMMPGMDGYEVLRQLREGEASDIPVIFLTALADASDEERGLQLGAVDYISKPINPSVVLARVRTQLEARQAREWMKDQNATLEDEVVRRMAENNITQSVSIRALAHLAEIRDPETGNHLHRTQSYVGALALALKNHPRFSDFLTERNISLLVKSAPLHDIGKVGVPDRILLKAGKLTSEEWVIMKKHAKFGSDAIELAEKDVEQSIPFLTLAKEIARWHHERYDGSGYPDGLVGEDIPISARLMALADVFDALTTPRVYKAAMSNDEARAIIVTERDRHFDPDIVDAFLGIFEEFIAIAQRYREST